MFANGLPSFHEIDAHERRLEAERVAKREAEGKRRAKAKRKPRPKKTFGKTKGRRLG